MSYLDIPRIGFSGDFQADVNTVNNDVRHYYNPAFTENNWVQAESGEGGWWNPDGGSTFRLINCSVKQVWYPDGSQTSNSDDDPVIGKNVAGPLQEASAKLVDLDPQFQFTSQLWGLSLCIFDSENEILLSGTVEPSGFKDLQFRNLPPIENGQPLGASWTSVITNIEWGPNAGKSKVLAELKRLWSETGMLSCQLVSFGYYKIIGGERFSLGRLLGSIGPYHKGDPRQFAVARRIIGLNKQEFGFSNGSFDEDRSLLTIDLGGSIPLSHPLGVPKDFGALYIGVARDTTLRDHLTKTSDGTYTISQDVIVKIGEIDYKKEGWLLQTAGLSDFGVTGEARELIENHQVVLFTDAENGNYQVLACETRNGLSVRADNNVRRIDTQTAGPVDFDFTIRTYQWGKSYPGGKVTFKRYTPAEFANDPDNPKECDDPKVPDGIDPKTGQVIQPCTNWPGKAILLNGEENAEIVSDQNGEVTVSVSVSDPGNPRGYIDGQIFLIGYQLEGLPIEQQYDLSFMGMWLMDALIMHVRNAFDEIKEPVWDDIAEIMTQYRNLYPLMSRNILDLGDPKAIAARQKIMAYAFTRDINDPTYMPVSRDLSEGKRKTIVNWLNTGMKGAEEGLARKTGESHPAAPPTPEAGNQNKQKLNVKTKDDFYKP
ncbi:MAG: hypothetical protein WBB45_13520 [Cyclobacteriaceae bacterium]